MDDIKINREIDEELIRALLREQHPDLAGLAVREVDGGWGNMMWRLGDDLAVRMPRFDGTPDSRRSEQRWLPTLAARLPLPIPVPIRVGEPSALFPKTWTVVRWVAGEPADHTPISRPEAADRLAEFLRALHRPAPPDLPANSPRAGALTGRERAIDRWLSGTDESRGRAARRVWEQAVAAPAWPDPPVWVHADLHPANVVVADGTLCGVVDWEELCSGDPATDLAAAWVLLPEGAASRFFEAYAIADEATIRRARGWAVMRALILISIGRQWEQGLPGGKQTWGPAGRAALEHALTT